MKVERNVFILKSCDCDERGCELPAAIDAVLLCQVWEALMWTHSFGCSGSA